MEVILVTGSERFLSRWVLKTLLAEHASAVLYLLAHPDYVVSTQQFVDQLPDEQKVRCRVLSGAVLFMNLGLTSDQYRKLSRELTHVFHLSDEWNKAKGGRALFRHNTEGTREVLELAGTCKNLERFCHLSTVLVSGTRTGVVMEDELDVGQGFGDAYQKSKFQAEKLVSRWMRRLPVTVVRSGLIVGHSKTGDLDADEPAFQLIARLIHPPRGIVTLPNGGRAPFHLVPVDYLARALVQLAFDEQGTSRVFHLTDPAPVAAKRFLDVVASKMHRDGDVRLIPAAVARVLLRSGWLDRVVGVGPVFGMSYLERMVFYNCQNALSVLWLQGLRQEGFDAYAEVLVRAVRDRSSRGGGRSSSPQVTDPLA
ncbi:MAG: SDR family oxidoreductase [Deltaproteobacteria bacterium]|nr:SDR family oxidoreductase [Deltaproteobacteria bacterium]